jgi:hypothetical protein
MLVVSSPETTPAKLSVELEPLRPLEAEEPPKRLLSALPSELTDISL